MPIEDFTTYTEVDANGKLTVTSSKAEGIDVDRDEDVYLYKDKGVDFFDALDIDFEIYMASTSLADGLAGMAIANTVNDFGAFATTDIVAFMREDTGAYLVFLDRGNFVATDFYTGSADTLYYCTLLRTAGNDTVSLKIYSDSARTNLLDTLAVAGFGTEKWRYVYGFVNYNNNAPGRDFDGYVQNLDLEPPDFLQAVGSGAIAIAGSLSTIKTVFQAVGAGSIAISGALATIKTIFLTVGAGSITISGSLNRLIKISVGAGSIAISGSLTTVKRFFQVVGAGSIAIAGSLNRKIKISVGEGAIAISGTLSTIRKIFQSVGGGSISIAGVLSFTVKRLRILVNFVGRSLTDTTQRDLKDDNDEFRKLK